MAGDTPRSYRSLVLCAMRKCPACERQVFVRNDQCVECGAAVPKPAPRIPRPRRELQIIPATGFGLEHAAAAMNLDTAAMPSIN
ncbi:MAG TPA: hypothetical protein VHE57_00795 [Mycobacteriales bacterium]|jgi:hypothetical protein|nr:hypothetical protein [Mycobacteriales bacterium]